MKNLLAFTISVLLLMTFPDLSHAAENSSRLEITKERLVLMPLRLGDEDKNRQAAMETALVEGLHKKYIVFSGEQVAQKAREIFLKETRNTTRKECDETKCMQNIAMAFQAELLAVASVSREVDGYFLALSIQNIFDNKVIYSKSVPCPKCTAYQVVDKLSELLNISADQKDISPYFPIGLYAVVQFGQVGSIAGVKDSAALGGLVGYDISDSYSVELGFASLYKNANADTMASNMVPGAAGTFTLNSFSLVGQYALHLSENIKLLGGLGFHKSSYKLDSGSVSMFTGNTTGLLLGLKAEYDMGKYFGLRAGVDAYNMGGNVQGLITNINAAALFKF
jgi:hypothetical protein